MTVGDGEFQAVFEHNEMLFAVGMGQTISNFYMQRQPKALMAAPFVWSASGDGSTGRDQIPVRDRDHRPDLQRGHVAFKKGFFKDAGLTLKYLNSQSGSRTKKMLAAATAAGDRCYVLQEQTEKIRKRFLLQLRRW